MAYFRLVYEYGHCTTYNVCKSRLLFIDNNEREKIKYRRLAALVHVIIVFKNKKVREQCPVFVGDKNNVQQRIIIQKIRSISLYSHSFSVTRFSSALISIRVYTAYRKLHYNGSEKNFERYDCAGLRGFSIGLIIVDIRKCRRTKDCT